MKPATAKAKGRQTEAALVDWLRVNGYPYAERRRLTGRDDQGDIAGIHGPAGSVVVEVKSGATLSLPQWLTELDREIHNAQADCGFVAVRPKNQPNPENWYAVLPLPAIIRLLKEAGR